MGPNHDSLFILLTLCFRAVLGPQKIKRKVRRFPIYSLPPPMHSLPHYQHPPSGGTFVTIGEPTLTNHHHVKSIVYIRIHSWCFTVYGFKQM